MKYRLILVVLLLVLQNVNSWAELQQKIQLVKERETLLKVGDDFLSDQNVRILKNVDFNKINSPFRVEEADAQGAGKEGTLAEEVINKKEILAQLSKNIKPNGSIKRGETYTLLFGKNFVNEGGSIKMTYKGKEYDVYIINIGEHAYTLKLDDAKLEQAIDSLEAKAIEVKPQET